MRQAILLAGFAALASASPASQATDFASVNSAPSPSLTGPPISANTQDVPVDSASVASSGSAAATAVASASIIATQTGLNKRTFFWSWSWGQPSQSSSTTTSQPAATSSVAPTTTTGKVTSTSATTSSDTACPTTPEAGTYCGFINPEDACAPQPDGYGPRVTPDTVAAFLAYPDFHETALAAKNPTRYSPTFKDLNASVSANTYLVLNTLKSYDVPGCATLCDNKDLCTGFNIFFERDPALNPSDTCTDVASITNYKCTLWGSGVNTESATNSGGYRNAFQVVIAGSNGYEKTNTTTPDTPSGWQHLRSAAEDPRSNHPSTCTGSHFFPSPYNPAICSAFALAQNSVNAKSTIWQKWLSFWTGMNFNPFKCNFFNSYMLKKNGKALGTYCSLYAQSYDGKDATYAPGWQGKDFWSIESPWSYQIQG